MHFGLKSVQTDPNFGNYLVCSDEDKDQLVLLDFGSAMCPDDDFLLHLGNVIAAGQARNAEAVADGLVGLGCLYAALASRGGQASEARNARGRGDIPAPPEMAPDA